MTKPSRNDPCPCGSGKKYKKCCGQAQKASKHSFTHLASIKMGTNMHEISKRAISSFGPNFQKNLEDKTGALAKRFTNEKPSEKEQETKPSSEDESSQASEEK